MDENLLNISFANCNNIISLYLPLCIGKLTVLFGPNGAGKSTVARCLAAETGVHAEDITGMVPYGTTDSPSITGLPEDYRVMIFNEDYIDETLFQDDDHLISDGYHVFIETDEYRKALNQTRMFFDSAKNELDAGGDLDSLINAMKELIDCYGKSKKGYAKTSPIGKSVAQQGDVIHTIPDEFQRFSPLIQSTDARTWISWRGKGQIYETKGICPYCAHELTSDDTELGNDLQTVYGGKYIDHMATVLSAFGKANSYLSPDASEKVDALLSTPLTSAMPTASEDLLKVIRSEAQTLLDHLEKIKALGYGSLHDISQLKNYVANLKIDAGNFKNINSEEVTNRIAAVNTVLDELALHISDAERAVGVQKSALRRAINASRKHINGFLEAAGFPYEISIGSNDGSSCVVTLTPRNLNEKVTMPTKRLSYGERNALAIALFAAQVESSSPDLVVLDDPISSFDQNKKYAIIQHLFAQNAGACSGDTTLLLTHDPECLSMLMRVHRDKLCPMDTLFLKNDNGLAKAMPVSPSDMESIVVWLRAQARTCSDLPSRIAFTRQLLELEGFNSEQSSPNKAAWSYLSCLVHRKKLPDVKEGSSHPRPMNAAEISSAQAVLTRLGYAVTEYTTLLSRLSDEELLSRTKPECRPMDKVCAFRILASSRPSEMKAAADRARVSNTVFEFASKYFHIENLLAFSLDPIQFSTIPSTVLAAIDNVLEEYKKFSDQVSFSSNRP